MARPAVRVLNRGGRPTRAEAERRQEHLIETAGAMFMKFGFDGTSIDAVAEAACMSKRTVYARYRDKNELFSAVLRNLIDRWLVPINQFQLGTRELEPMLMKIGRQLLTSALAPQVVSLHRIIVGESERRPEFGLLANAEGRQPLIRGIAAVLKRQGSQLRVNDFERAAEQFISLVVDNGLRLAAFGTGPAPRPQNHGENHNSSTAFSHSQGPKPEKLNTSKCFPLCIPGADIPNPSIPELLLCARSGHSKTTHCVNCLSPPFVIL